MFGRDSKAGEEVGKLNGEKWEGFRSAMFGERFRYGETVDGHM